MISLYEAATVEDVYVAYEQLKVDENCLFSCIGIAGSQAGDHVTGEVRCVELVICELLRNCIYSN